MAVKWAFDEIKMSVYASPSIAENYGVEALCPPQFAILRNESRVELPNVSSKISRKKNQYCQLGFR